MGQTSDRSSNSNQGIKEALWTISNSTTVVNHKLQTFQYSYNTGIYPTMWKIAQVCPLHKKQDNSNPANYHPTKLLSIISKVMEDVINCAIKQRLLSNNLLSDAQFGFRQGLSAPDLITALVQMWTKELNSRG
eukprot:g41777.t1